MNITLSVDEQVVTRARETARAMGKSLNQLIRDYLESLSGQRDAATAIAELRRLSDLGQGRSREGGFAREDAYDRPIFSR